MTSAPILNAWQPSPTEDHQDDTQQPSPPQFHFSLHTAWLVKRYSDCYACRSSSSEGRCAPTHDIRSFPPRVSMAKNQPKFTTLHMTLGVEKDVSRRGTKKTKLRRRPKGRDGTKLDKKSRDAATVVLRNIEVCVCVMILLPCCVLQIIYHINHNHLTSIYALLYSMLILLVSCW